MLLNNMVKFELSDIDSALFLEFQKNYDTFSVLQNSGIFDIRNGLAQINFDGTGTISDIDCNFKLYKRGKPVLVALHIPK